MASKTYQAGVKDYRQNYWTPDYVPLDTDLLACFKVVAQAGVPREEAAAAVAAEIFMGLLPFDSKKAGHGPGLSFAAR